MRGKHLGVWLGLLCVCMGRAHAADVKLARIRIHAPLGWNVQQTAFSDETWIAGFANGDDYIQFYSKAGTSHDLRAFAVNGSKIEEDANYSAYGPFQWNTMLSSMPTKDFAGNYYVRSFSAKFEGNIYYGYSRSQNGQQATQNMRAFLDNILVELNQRSLTGPEYSGKKYYLGWGAAMMWDPDEMQNEVKYDVLHTENIFTKDVGGGYIGKDLIGYSSATASNIKKEWNRLKGLMTANDMFVQYSSGHGSESGLAVGVSYDDIANNTLSYPAKELIVFTMACYSGNLVDSFNNQKSKWQNFASQGRTLMVMSSSASSEESSTGPGTDVDEGGGPDGSAGSAFGFALWKALIGYSDGSADGVKDGFISLGEIKTFVVQKTQEVGSHTPQITGVFNGSLIMNRVPPHWLVEEMERSLGGLSDAEIMKRLQAMDAMTRIR